MAGSETNATDCYVLFSSHTDALALLEALRAANVAARVSPTPRAARASCGVALLIPCDMRERAAGLALEIGVKLDGIVELPRQIDPLRDKYC